VGETVRDAAWLGAEALVFGDLLDPAVMRRKLRLLRAAKLDHAEQIMTESGPAPGLGERLDRLRATNGEALAGHYGRMATRSGVRVERDSVAAPLLRQRAPVLFEGAHGVLLDRENGLRPHVTSTDTTLAPATALLAELSPGGRPFRLGVVRAYATRHGAGPFPTEDAMLTERLPEAHNVANEWQGRMRAGWLDLAALRHALAVAGGIDALAVTCLDRLSGLASVRVAVGYEPAGGPGTGHAGPLGGGRPVLGELAGWSEDLRGCRRPADLPEAARRFLRFLASSAGLGVPIALVSVGPRAAETIFWEDDE
jgi:adenylosuccinate synthase